MKKSGDTIGNQTHDLTACSTVPQPTAPPRAPHVVMARNKLYLDLNVWPENNIQQ